MYPINRNLPRPSTLCLLTTICLAAWLAFGRPSTQPQPAHASVSSTAIKAPSLSDKPVSRIKPISEVQLGERAIGKNPLREQVDESHPEPDPQTWRKLTLRLPKENGKWLTVELLRPLDWIEHEAAAVGETVFLDLEEMGAIGDAKVVSIEPCPPIQPGKSNIITGKFIHEVTAGKVIELRFANQPEATRVTKNHPYWSADRHDFIPAGELREGEQVESLTGPTRIASITPSNYSGLVYNLETNGEHVYRVGSSGLLAHNACTRRGLPAPHGPNADHHIFPQQFREFFNARGINIDQFTVTVNHSITHLKGIHGRGNMGQYPGRWNKKWAEFIREKPDATAKEVYQFAGGLMDQFNLSGLLIHAFGQ